jgi:hypothetical protein
MAARLSMINIINNFFVVSLIFILLNNFYRSSRLERLYFIRPETPPPVKAPDIPGQAPF